jgi:hypothetical protein
MPNRSIAVRNRQQPLVYKRTTQPRDAVFEVADGAFSRATLFSIRRDLRRAETIAARRRDMIGLAAANAAIRALDKQILHRGGLRVR